MVLYDDLEAEFKTKAVQPLEKKVILICKANVNFTSNKPLFRDVI